MATSKRLIPTGNCWCGCGAETSIRPFFLQGHGKTAESAVIAVEYGGVLGFLVLHGYGPSRKNDTGEAASGLRQTHPRRRWPVSPRNGASRRPRLSD